MIYIIYMINHNITSLVQAKIVLTMVYGLVLHLDVDLIGVLISRSKTSVSISFRVLLSRLLIRLEFQNRIFHRLEFHMFGERIWFLLHWILESSLGVIIKLRVTLTHALHDQYRTQHTETNGHEVSQDEGQTDVFIDDQVGCPFC